MFQEGALRWKEASGLPLQCKGCKLRCLENSRARRTAQTVRWLVRGAEAHLKHGHSSASAQCYHVEGQGFQVFMRNCKSGLIFKCWGHSINIQARFGLRAMSLTPLVHCSPLSLQMGSQKYSGSREGWILLG